MSSQDAGAAIVYLPNSSRDLGSSGADGARLRTGASDLSAGLLALAGAGGSRFPMRCQVGLVLRQLPEPDRAVLSGFLTSLDRTVRRFPHGHRWRFEWARGSM
jgi:hypothetical protein